MSVVTRASTFAIFQNPDGASIKRIAWAFGCAKKNSDEEIQLYKILLARAAKITAERARDAAEKPEAFEIAFETYCPACAYPIHPGDSVRQYEEGYFHADGCPTKEPS